MSETKKGFDLASVLKDVSGLDTSSREQIEYIDIDLIDSDPANFYELSEIDKLAANIETVGLQQPLRVRDNPAAAGHVTIVSGHRRRAAIQKLVDDGRADLREIACIKEQPSTSPALQELRLIYANSDTRRMSSADVSKQVERVEALLYQLKEEGYEFPGRMRDHVAEACKVSQTKLARLKVIRDKLADCWTPAFEEAVIGESCAYALAQMPAEHQHAIWEYWTGHGKPIQQLYEGTVRRYGTHFAKLEKLKCSKCKGACENVQNKRHKALIAQSWQTVTCVEKCCSVCSDLARCKYACPKLADKITKLKADAKEQRKQEKLAQEEHDRPIIKRIQQLWDRFGQARNAAGISVKDACKALGRNHYWVEDSDVVKFECLEEKFTADTKLPYSYDCKFEDIEKFVRLADLFKCSIDYLFCRTDNPGGFVQTSAVAPTTDVEVVPAIWYPASVEPPIGRPIIIKTYNGFAEDTTYLGCATLGDCCASMWPEVEMWTIAPSEASNHEFDVLAVAQWRSGTEDPATPLDAVAIFSIDGLADPLRKIARWNGSSWQFPGGASIEAKCIRWLPLPPEE